MINDNIQRGPNFSQIWQKIGFIIPTDKVTAIFCLIYVDNQSLNTNKLNPNFKWMTNVNSSLIFTVSLFTVFIKSENSIELFVQLCVIFLDNKVFPSITIRVIFLHQEFNAPNHNMDKLTKYIMNSKTTKTKFLRFA